MIVELRHLSYEERLQSLALLSILMRRLRGDVLEVSKILNGFHNID